MNTSLKKYRQSKKGILTNMFNHQKIRNIKKGFGEIGYNLFWLQKKFLEDIKFNRLYNEWADSGYIKAKKPSIDRINHNKGYTKDNIQLLSWADNRFKQTIERRSRKGKVAQILNGKIIKIWNSQREAWRTLNINQSMISLALTGKCKTAYGYEWYYISNIRKNKE